MKIYKLYVGEYNKKCIPPLTLIEKTDEKLLMQNIRKLLEIIPYGMDIYIGKTDGIIYGYHKDLESHTETEIMEMLQ